MSFAEAHRRSPYQGLIPYSEADAAFFFGREKETRLIIANLFASPLTLLYGASGVGKSSVLRAGVAHQLRQREDVLIVVFNSWQSNPVSDLKQAVADFADLADHDAWRKAVSLLPQDRPASLSEFLAICASQLNRRLMIILDQFEEYFLYHPQDGEFAAEFPRAVTHSEAPVSFLISIREDFYAKLDRFEGRIPTLYDNYLRIEHLDHNAARVAIEQPIATYNQQYGRDGQFSIEPKLVEAILKQVETGRVILGEAGRGVIEGTQSLEGVGAQIETPFLQLVMTRLWDEELRVGSRELRLATLTSLGGAENIVRSHLDAVMIALSPGEQEIAANVFHYLVTPSGTKIAYTASDLALSAGLEEPGVMHVLEKLSHGDVRILRPVDPGSERPTAPRYEIFHDVLAPSILVWRAKYAQVLRQAASEAELARTRQRARRLRWVMVGLILLLLVMTGLTAFAFQQRRAAINARADADTQKQKTELALEDVTKEKARVEQEKTWAEAQTSRAELASIQAKKAEEVAQNQRKAAELAQSNAEKSAHAANVAAAESRSQQRIAFSRFLTSKALSNLDDKIDTSLLLGIEASRFADLSEGRGVLLEALERDSRLTGLIVGHTKLVNSVAVSPDGKTVASGSDDQTVILSDMATRKQLALFKHGAAVLTVAFSPDGKLLASGGEDGVVNVWNANSSGAGDSKRLVSRGEPVDGLAFSPDGKLLAANSEGETILWDLGTQKPIGKPLPGSGSSGYARQMAFSPDGKILVPPALSGKLTLWDVNSLKPFDEIKASAYTVAFSPDGTILATNDWGTSEIRLWSMATRKQIGEPLKSLTAPLDIVTHLAFSRDGKLLAACREDGGVALWDVTMLKPIEEALTSRKSKVGGLAFGEDNILVSGSGSEVIVWDLKAKSRLVKMLSNYTTGTSLAIDREGKMLATEGWDKSIKLWDAATGAPLGEPLLGHRAVVSRVAFSPDGRKLASASDAGEIVFWDIATRKPIGAPLSAPEGPVAHLAFTPDGKSLICDTYLKGGADFAEGVDRITVWDVESHKQIHPPLDWAGDFTHVTAWSPNGRVFAKFKENEVILWDVFSGKQLGAPLTAHTAAVSEMLFSPDGQILVTAGGYDKKLIFWNVQRGKPIGDAIEGHDLFTTALAFSPDGKLLAAAANDEGILVCDVASHKVLGQPLRSQAEFLTSLAFSPDSKTLVSGSQDGEIVLWDVTSGLAIGPPLHPSKAQISTLIFASNGGTVVASGADAIIVLDLNVDSWRARACDIAGRNLSRSEWETYFGKLEYHKTCENLPVHYSFSDDGADLALDIENFLLNSITKEAVATYLKAKKLNKTQAISAEVNNDLCWQGILNGYLSEVMSACDQASTLQPKNGNYRDSRGVARALSGDLKGAIEDFQVFVDWTDDELKKKQRRQWIIELGAGKNPFPEELKKLRNQ